MTGSFQKLYGKKIKTTDGEIGPIKKDQIDANSSFTLFPDACPTGDTSGYKPPLCDLIEKRAYELFEQRGRIDSDDLQNWLQAEREVKHHLGV